MLRARSIFSCFVKSSFVKHRDILDELASPDTCLGGIAACYTSTSGIGIMPVVMTFSRRRRDQTKLATQTSMLPTPFRPPCTPSKLASHASRNARTKPRSLSSPTSSSTSRSKEEERQAETSHCPSNKPSPPGTRVSLSSRHRVATASSVSRFGPSTVRTLETLLALLRHSSAAWASAAST